MKNTRFTARRRNTRKGKMRTVFAKINRKRRTKKHRAAVSGTAEDWDDPEASIGIARALLVILLIHVIAIGGIFYHSYHVEHRQDKAAQAEPDKPKVYVVTPEAAATEDRKQKIQPSDQIYMVGTGETYAVIAKRFGIDEMALREANDNVQVRQGRYLRIPAKKVAAVEPVATNSDIKEVKAAAPPAVEVAANDLVRTEAAREIDFATTSGSTRPSAPKAIPVTESTTPASATPVTTRGSYTVKNGDTPWSIAQKHGTTPEKLMQANGIKDARKLRIGMSLKIPQ